MVAIRFQAGRPSPRRAMLVVATRAALWQSHSVYILRLHGTMQ